MLVNAGQHHRMLVSGVLLRCSSGTKNKWVTYKRINTFGEYSRTSKLHAPKKIGQQEICQ